MLLFRCGYLFLIASVQERLLGDVEFLIFASLQVLRLRLHYLNLDGLLLLRLYRLRLGLGG